MLRILEESLNLFIQQTTRTFPPTHNFPPTPRQHSFRHNSHESTATSKDEQLADGCLLYCIRYYNMEISGPTNVHSMKRRTPSSNVPSLVCAFLASATTGGTIYAFGIYGDALKKSLNLSQMQLDTISATFFIAGLLSWLPGLVVDRMGTRFSMCLGGISGALHVIIYWAVSRQLVQITHVVMVLSILAVGICLSCGLIIGSIFKLAMLCGGPGTKGSAVGVAKGYVGLGAGIYATIFQALRTEDESALDFLPVIAFFFILCASLPSWFLLPSHEQTASPHVVQIETTPLHFRTLYLSLLALSIVIVASSVAEILNDNIDGKHKRDYWKVIFIMTIWLGPIVSILFLPRRQYKDFPTIPEDHSGKIAPQADLENEPRGEKQTLLRKSHSNGSSREELAEQRPDSNLLEMLRTPSAWLMLWTSTILVGSGTYKTNNMGEMVESLGFPDALTPATLAIFSVAQAASRIITGVASEAALKWKGHFSWDQRGVSRPYFLLIASSIAVLAHVMLAISTSQIAFVIGCSTSGIAFGMTWPLMVLIVGDIFGVEHHGANYMFYDGFTKAIGTLSLSDYVAGTVYEAHAGSQEADGFACLGPSCFRETHVIVAFLALTGVGASLALVFTSRSAYKAMALDCE